MSGERETCGEPCPDCGTACRTVVNLGDAERGALATLGFDPDATHDLHAAEHADDCRHQDPDHVLGSWPNQGGGGE